MELSYDGTNYHGWQNQPNALTVQSCVENALKTILKTNIPIYAAGRTDSGVHAIQMYVHFDFDNKLDFNKIIHDLNSFLPYDISINNIFKVKDDFHARFDAISREYKYVISIKKNVFDYNKAYFLHKDLDLLLMNKACQILKNYKNFKCFSRSNSDVKTYNCDVQLANWVKSNNKITFIIKANRFLRNMVRAIVGTMIQVGMKKINLNEFEKIITSQNRINAGPSAPAHGLFLAKIEYPKRLLNNE